MTYPVANFLVQIKNAYMANKNEMSFHREESKWLVKEFDRLNKDKFTKYLKKHLKNN